ncbi:globin domain-containing protein [Acinetobacter chinensis]|uniref:Globin domain-containing protein n=1 Tax=Acinetobacter chinensis TaxID=2004650 RepID=A0ABU3WHA3_9GAMM|nr:globin domain-containing protein [Acinetobacter chinensis]MDV2469433.1 globin domain-containing protein [Acinetobacter chinensis]
MTPEHIELVKSTVPVLRENGVALTSYFYKRMLNNNPELNNVFNLDSQNSGRQPRALAAAVLAYAENIENPAVLAKAVEHIATKHVSLDIQPDQYAIVGENLLHSISEVLNVPFESELIAAWKAAYLQLADILIGVEKQKYENLAAQNGGWAGWRAFEITAVEATEAGKIFTVQTADKQATVQTEVNEFISVKVKVPGKDIEQPHQYTVLESTENTYRFEVKPEENHTEYSVSNILLGHYKTGDQVQLTAPQKK